MITTARTLTLALQGRWSGRYGTAPCPICQPEHRSGQNALTLADGQDGSLLLDCKKAHCAFSDLLDALRGLGLVMGRGDHRPMSTDDLAKFRTAECTEAAKKAKQARMLWDGAMAITGTLAERYLNNRGITRPLPESLRFHPAAWHPIARPLPAMVARVDGAERFAVHRTYLAANGSGKAQVDPTKAMLGSTKGGAVRLADGDEVLAVAEGIETALSLLCGPLTGSVAVLAALSASGMAGLHLPHCAGRLIIAVNGDPSGRTAAAKLAERATALAWRVTLLVAAEGRDFNDMIQKEAAV